MIESGDGKISTKVTPHYVTPAQSLPSTRSGAGVQYHPTGKWIPAFAGMTFGAVLGHVLILFEALKTKGSATGRVFAAASVILAGLNLLIAARACGDLTEAASELDRLEEIVFAVRQPKGPHWYESIGYAITDMNDKVYGSAVPVQANFDPEG
jgi:hypothetical protein